MEKSSCPEGVNAVARGVDQTFPVLGPRSSGSKGSAVAEGNGGQPWWQEGRGLLQHVGVKVGQEEAGM